MSLTGILLDVSGSMRENIESGTDEESKPWAESIFKVIDDLIEQDLSSENRVFAIGFGADCENREIFDVIGTIQQLENIEIPVYSKKSPAAEDKINAVFDILEENNARNIRKWAKNVFLIQEVVSDYMASLILGKLQSDKLFLKHFVNDILPSPCRNQTVPITQLHPATLAWQTLEVALVAWWWPPVGIICGAEVIFEDKVADTTKTIASSVRQATKEDIEEIVKKVKCYFLKGVNSHSIFSVKDASNIVRGYVDKKELSKKRAQEMLESVKPFIYGKTPLYQSLEKAVTFFEENKLGYKENNGKTNKLLFIVSDGVPTDGSNKDIKRINQIASKFGRRRRQSCIVFHQQIQKY